MIFILLLKMNTTTMKIQLLKEIDTIVNSTIEHFITCVSDRWKIDKNELLQLWDDTDNNYQPPIKSSSSTKETVIDSELSESTSETAAAESPPEKAASESTPEAESTSETEAVESPPEKAALESTPEAASTSETAAVESPPEKAALESTPEAASAESTPEKAALESTPEAASVESTPETAAAESTSETAAAESTSETASAESKPETESTKIQKCPYVYIKGKKEGQTCNSKTKKGNVYCSRHKKFEGTTVTKKKKILPTVKKTKKQIEPDITLVFNKTINKIWHNKTRLVFKSKDELIVIGKYIEGELTKLTEEDINTCKSNRFIYDKNCVEVNEENKQEQKMDDDCNRSIQQLGTITHELNTVYDNEDGHEQRDVEDIIKELLMDDDDNDSNKTGKDEILHMLDDSNSVNNNSTDDDIYGLCI